jgi:large subunit ribosomal protein L30
MSAVEKAGAGTIIVRQVKSGIGFSMRQKRVLRALGLGRIGRERVHPDNPAIRGMVSAVCHLVKVAGEDRSGS